nr:K166 [uncultured bacterium]
MSTVIDANTRAEIEALVIEHAYLLDHHQSEKLADLYTEDGKMHGIGPTQQGRAALLEYGKKRAAMKERQARHVCSNLRLVADGPDRIRGSLIITLFRTDGPAMGTADPVAVADANDIYVRKDGRWRIAERRLSLAFESEAHRR